MRDTELGALRGVGLWITKRRLRFVPVVIGYFILTAVAVHPLLVGLTTTIVGVAGQHEDFAQFYWNVWWFQHSLFSLGHDPYFTNYILFPFTVNLAYHTFTPVLNVLALPIYVTLGLTAALNSWVVGSLIFNGLAMSALLRHHKVGDGLAFTGGALFAFTSATMSRVSFVHLSMIPNGWMPLSVLALDWLIDRHTWKGVVLLGGVLYAALMTDIQFLVWLALLLPFYGLFRFVGLERHIRGRVVILGLLAIAVLLGLSLIAPLPQLMAGFGQKYGEEFQGIIEDWYSTHFEDLISLPVRHLLSERATLGVLLPLGVIVGLFTGRRVRGRWFWLAAGLGFLILAFGPTLKPWGIPLPFRLFYAVAGGTYRVAARFLLPAVFALIVFVALSLQPLYERFTRGGRRAAVVGVLVLLALENRWYEPLPTFTMPDYQVYHQIGAEPGEYLILEVPVGPENLFRGIFGHGAVLQYYAPIHHKQLINGAVSRAPEGLTQAYRQWPLITALAEEGPMPEIASARAEFERLSNEWNIQYVLVHRDMLESETATWAAGFFNTQPDWCLVDEEGPILIYSRIAHTICAGSRQLDLPPDGKIDLSKGNEKYLGPGWYYTESVGGPLARWIGREITTTLRVNLPPREYRVTLQASTIVPDQLLTVYVNGQRVADLPIGGGWNGYAFDLSAGAIAAGQITTIDLVPAKRRSPQELTNGQSEDRRLLAVALTEVRLVLR